ncbi:hypothetical protein FXF75_21230 [Halorussus sp. MSC15.2]|nr:hypothetical protein [Halorussus sp. MSC15.2]
MTEAARFLRWRGPRVAISGRIEIDEETAMRVAHHALAVETPIWMIGDSVFDMLNWHDVLLEENVVPVASYNPRNTDEPLDIEYRAEDQIKDHFEKIRVHRRSLRKLTLTELRLRTRLTSARAVVSDDSSPEAAL